MQHLNVAEPGSAQPKARQHLEDAHNIAAKVIRRCDLFEPFRSLALPGIGYWLLAILRDYSRRKPPYPGIHRDDNDHKCKASQNHGRGGEAIANYGERGFPVTTNDQSGEKDSAQAFTDD